MSKNTTDEHRKDRSDQALQVERDQEKLDIATAYRDAASGSEASGLSNGRMGNQATSQILSKGKQQNSRNNKELNIRLKLMLDRIDEIQRELARQLEHVNEQLRVAGDIKDLIASGKYDSTNPLHQMMLDYVGYPEDGREQLTTRSMDDHIVILEERREHIVDAQNKLAEIRAMSDEAGFSDDKALETIEQALTRFESIEESRAEVESELSVSVDQEIQRFMLSLAMAERMPDSEASHAVTQAALKLLSDEAISNLSSSEDTKHLFESGNFDRPTEISHNTHQTNESKGPSL